MLGGRGHTRRGGKWVGSKVGRGDVDEYGELGKLGAIRAIGWGTVYNRF